MAMTDQEFGQALKKLLIAYGGKNEEGKPNIEVTIVDRRKYERLHYEPVPYSHFVTGLKDEALVRRYDAGRLKTRILNFSIAAEALTSDAGWFLSQYYADGWAAFAEVFKLREEEAQKVAKFQRQRDARWRAQQRAKKSLNKEGDPS